MNDLEFLREIFKDPRLHIGIGVITKLGLANDGSILRAMVNLIPENREIVCEVGFADVNDVTFPEISDLVLVGHVDGDVDEAFIFKVLNNKEEKIPQFAQSGNSVKYARSGKKLYLGSDSKVGVGRPNVDPTSPMVLGDVMLNCLTDLMNAFLNSANVGQHALGPVILDPQVKLALQQALNKYVTTTSTNINSQIAFTERGV